MNIINSEENKILFLCAMLCSVVGGYLTTSDNKIGMVLLMVFFVIFRVLNPTVEKKPDWFLRIEEIILNTVFLCVSFTMLINTKVFDGLYFFSNTEDMIDIFIEMSFVMSTIYLGFRLFYFLIKMAKR